MPAKPVVNQTLVGNSVHRPDVASRIIGHTHPYGLGSIGPSAADAVALRALRQTHSYVVDGARQIVRVTAEMIWLSLFRA